MAVLSFRRRRGAPLRLSAACAKVRLREIAIYQFTIEGLESRRLLSTVNWTNAAGGDWDTATNWSTDSVPNSTQDAVISIAVSTPITHKLSNADSVNSLTTSAPMNFSLGSLTVVTTLTSSNKFTLSGGTIAGGTIITTTGGEFDLSGGALSALTIEQSGSAPSALVLTGSAGTLNNVTLPLGSVLDDTTVNGAYAYVTNGFTDNGTVELGKNSTSSPTYGRLFFQGTQTLGGTGSVVFGTYGYQYNVLFVQDTGNPATLTLGSSLTVTGGSGSIQADSNDASIVLDGTVMANSAGDTIAVTTMGSVGTLSNAGTLTANNGGTLSLAGSWSNTGTISLGNNSTVILGGTVTTAGLGQINNTGGTLNLTGMLTNTGSTLALTVATTGSVNGATTTVAGPLYLVGGTIIGGTVSDVAGADLVLTSSSGYLNGTTLAANSVLDGMTIDDGYAYVTNGFTVNGTVELGNNSTSSATYGRLFFQGSQTLGGTGSVVFGNYYYYNALYIQDSSGPATLTLGSTLLVAGGYGSIEAQSGDASIVLDGTVMANTAGDPIAITPGGTGTLSNAGTLIANNGGTLTLAGSWSNTGTISVGSGSAVNLGGTITTAGLGAINNTGGTVNLTGVLTNTGTTLALTAASTGSVSGATTTVSGSLYLVGGTIIGGAISDVPGVDLILTGSSGYLNGVTLAANSILDGTMVNGAYAYVTNGFTANGTVDLGNDSTSAPTYGRLFFQGTQTLGGTGSVIFGTYYYYNALYIQDTSGAATLTLGSSLTVEGGYGSIQDQSGDASIVLDGTVTAGTAGDPIAITPGSTGTLSNAGTLSANNGGTLSLAGSWSNTGTISVGSGSAVNLGGTITTAGLGAINNTGGTVNLTGVLTNTGTTLALTAASTGSVSGATTTIPGSLYLLGGSIVGGAISDVPGVDLILTGSSGYLNGVTLAANSILDGTMVNGAYAYVTNGFTANGTVDLGNESTSAPTYGRLFFQGSQTLGGTGSVVFGSYYYYNTLYIQDTSGPATLTLGGSLTVEGGYGSIQDESGDASIVLDGTVIASTTGDTISITPGGTGTLSNAGTLIANNGGTLSLAGSWSNTGTISVGSGSAVNLGGTITTAGLGAINNTGGTLNLTGVLTNTGTTLALTAASTGSVSGATTTIPGSVRLLGGTIIGGTISDVPGADLILTTSGGYLNGVTLAANSILDGTVVSGAYAYVTNGFTANGTVELGNSSTSSPTYAYLYFEGTQTLGGTGSVVFGSYYYYNALYVEDTSGPATLTLGSSLTVEGGSGYIQDESGDGSIVLDGTVMANTASNTITITPGSTGTLTSAGTLTANNGGTLTLTGISNNVGIISVGNGSTINLGGSITTASLSHITNTGGSLNLTGTLTNTGTTLALTTAATSSVSGSTYMIPGPLYLQDGTIIGGTVSDVPGAFLTLRSGGTLNGVTIAADSVLDGTQIYGGYAYVTNGLTVNGTVELGSNSTSPTYGYLLFQGTQTLGGTGSVVFGNEGSNGLYIEDSSGPATFTLGGSVTVMGGAGFIDDESGDASIVLDGTVSANTPGDTIYIYSGSSSPVTNAGTLSVGPRSVISIEGNYTQTSAGTLAIQIGGTPTSGSFGTVNVSGTASFAGSLVATLANGYVPAGLNSYTVAKYASSSGSLNFIPPSSSLYTFGESLNATNILLTANGQGDQAPQFTSTSTSATFAAGTSNTYTFTSNGVPIPALTVSGSLPDGVTFTDNGDGTATLSGMPSAASAGNYSLTVTANNNVSPSASQAFTLTVNPGVSTQGPTITSSSTAVFAPGLNNSFTFTTTGTPTPSLMETGTLPSGVTFVDNGNGTATLSGNPAVASNMTFPISIQVSNGVGTPAAQSFLLSVAIPTITVTGTTVVGDGTDANDTASVSYSGGMVVVVFDGVTQSFSTTSINSVNINLGSGRDTVMIGSSLPTVSVNGGNGTDLVVDVNLSPDTIIGGAGNNTLMGGGAGSLLKGKAGNDFIIAGHLNSGVSSAQVAAALASGPGAIRPFISSASDVTVRGKGGNNTLVGTGGDKLVGGAGNDFFFDSGYKGDSINGGTTGLHFAQYNPNDSMSNIFQVLDPPKGAVGTVAPAIAAASPLAATVVTDSVNAAGVLKVVGTSDSDTIKLSSDGTNINITANGTALTPVPLADLTGVSVKGKAGDDTITIGKTVLLPATLNGNNGNDSLTGGGGDNVIISGIGNSTLVGGAGLNLLSPGGLETYSDTSPGNDSLVGGSGGMTIADFAYRLDGMVLSNDGKADSGDPALGETMTIAPTVTGILAGTGNDTIMGTVLGELLSGGRGNNSIHGGGVDDTIAASKGTDSVVVAVEPVVLFILKSSPDTVSGINDPTQDILSYNTASDVLS